MNILSTTPHGMWRYGDDYRKAATYVLIQHPDQPFVPYYSLLGQSIELSLKAFLLAQGVSLSHLKTKFGHNLKALVKEACRRGIESQVELSNVHWAVIDLLSDEYMSKRFQYIRNGQMLIPDIRLGHEAAELLSEGLKACCESGVQSDET